MSSGKKMVTVFGATGHQGGSAIEPLQKAGFQLRGVTRDANKETAKKLEQKGVEVVECDLANDSVDKIADVLKDSYGAFLLTDFWDKSMMGKEDAVGKKLVDATKKAGVKHVVFSTLANVEKFSNGKYEVPHFTDKAKVEEYIREMQDKSKPFEHVSFVAPAFYYQNFKIFFPPKEEGDTLVFTLPETNSNDTGKAIAECFTNPDKWELKRIDLAGTHQSPQQFIEVFQKVLGRKARLNSVPRDEYAKSGSDGAEEMAHMFGWFDEFGYYGPEADFKSGKAAVPDLKTWEEYLKTSNDWNSSA